MGQGSDSCNAWDVEPDDYEDGLEEGRWTMQNGASILVSEMTIPHMRNAINTCLRAQSRETFSSDEEKWDDWIDVFESEIESRADKQKASRMVPKKPTRGSKLDMKCHCGNTYQTRAADVKRNWGLSCSKSCSAKRKMYNLPAAVKI